MLRAAGRRSTSRRSRTATPGSRAKQSALGLVDEVATGDELLFRARDEARLYEVTTEARKNLLQQLLSGLGGCGAESGGFRGDEADLIVIPDDRDAVDRESIAPSALGDFGFLVGPAAAGNDNFEGAASSHLSS